MDSDLWNLLEFEIFYWTPAQKCSMNTFGLCNDKVAANV